jgi:hypothetical protein
VIGGRDASGVPTDTVFAGTPDAESGRVTTWTESADLKLPAPRADAAVVVSGDGIFLIGGRDAEGVVATVWQAPLNATTGALRAWRPNEPLADGRAGATAFLQGTHLFLYGGVDASGPTTAVVRGEVAAEGETIGQVTRWLAPTAEFADQTNLPIARAGAMGFVSNGILYHVGGEGGAGELYWSVPDAEGNLTGWKTLPESDLPADLQLADAAPVVSGPHAFLVGGTVAGSPTQGVARASLTPPQPYFQVGLFYVVVPALGIQGEVGQQLSYLAAAGAATGNFVLLLLIGYAYNHKAQTKALWERFRNRRRAAP